MAAFGAETGRPPPQALARVAFGAVAMVAALAEAVSRRGLPTTMTDDAWTGDAAGVSPEARDRPIATFSTMLGALLLAQLGVGPDSGRRVLEVAHAEIMVKAKRANGEP